MINENNPEFAENMERNSNSYQTELEIVDEQVAWRVGPDRYLALQTCEDGYDYTLYDKDFREIDGGQLDNPELSMLEARNEILEDFGLQMCELRLEDYEEIMEKVEVAEFTDLSYGELER